MGSSDRWREIDERQNFLDLLEDVYYKRRNLRWSPEYMTKDEVKKMFADLIKSDSVRAGCKTLTIKPNEDGSYSISAE